MCMYLYAKILMHTTVRYLDTIELLLLIIFFSSLSRSLFMMIRGNGKRHRQHLKLLLFFFLLCHSDSVVGQITKLNKLYINKCVIQYWVFHSSCVDAYLHWSGINSTISSHSASISFSWCANINNSFCII